MQVDHLPAVDPRHAPAIQRPGLVSEQLAGRDLLGCRDLFSCRGPVGFDPRGAQGMPDFAMGSRLG